MYMKNYTFDQKIDVLHKDKSTTEIIKMHKDFSKIFQLSAVICLVLNYILLSIDFLHVLIILLTVRPFPLNNSFLKNPEYKID